MIEQKNPQLRVAPRHPRSTRFLNEPALLERAWAGSPAKRLDRKNPAGSANGHAGPECPVADVTGHVSYQILLVAADSSAIQTLS
ncbi:MAG: hypothetical protein MUF81_17320, partial [Verrucomicrobia bacterium]|nr:hypothetical protein [Verrucomicrobiota bacterium]